MAALVAPATLYRLTVETPVLPKTCHICRPPSSLPNFRPAFVVSLKSGLTTEMLYLEPQLGGQPQQGRQGSSWWWVGAPPQPGSGIPITLESVTSLGPPPAVSPADCPH